MKIFIKTMITAFMQVVTCIVTHIEIISQKPDLFIICTVWFLMGAMWIALIAIEIKKTT